MKANSTGMVLVSEAALSEMQQAVGQCESTNNKAAALFHLLNGECDADESEGVFSGMKKRGRLSCGIMLLCQDMIAELDGRHDAAFDAMRKLKGIGLNTEPLAKEGAR